MKKSFESGIMSCVWSLTFGLLVAVLGCSKDSISEEDSIGMLGFKLGQEILLDDAAWMKENGVSIKKTDKYGRVVCRFKARERFLTHDKGELVVNPDNNKVLLIESKVYFTPRGKEVDPKSCLSSMEVLSYISTFKKKYDGKLHQDLGGKDTLSATATIELEQGCGIMIAQDSLDDSIEIRMVDRVGMRSFKESHSDAYEAEKKIDGLE